MTTAIWSHGGIGSAIARQLAGGETRGSQADHESARTLAADRSRCGRAGDDETRSRAPVPFLDCG